MFSRPQKPSREEEKLLARRSHELTVRSLASPTATASLPPPSPQPTSPLRLSGPNSHYYRSNMPSVSGKPNGSTTTITDAIPSPDALNSRPTVINDSFTGEPKASLIPDHSSALGSPFMLEGCDARSAPQDRFWSHVAKIRELQSDVARMHIAMESIGRQPEPQPPKEKEKEKDKDKPRKYRGQTTAGRASMAAANSTDREETAQSASDTDHAGSGRDTRSGPKATDVPAAGVVIDTGEHFVQRKEAIQNIMKKLSELSYQVSEFHQLPTPEITFPISPTRQTQPQSPLTPTQASTFSIPSPGQTSLTYQTPRTTKTGPFQSALGLQGQAPPRLTIPNSQLQVPGSRTEPTTPSKAKPQSIISQDGTFHESPASLQAGRTP